MKNIRWYVFWIIDFLKGRPVRKYYNEVKDSFIHGTSTEYTQTKIRQLINHAVKTTDFYQSYNRYPDINQLPVMNKSLYKDHYDKFLSSKYKNAKSIRKKRTSGSTGIPFTMVQNRDKIHHNTAASIFLCSLGSYFIGMKQAFIRVWLDRNKKSRFRSILENIWMIDASKLDEKRIKTISKHLLDKNYKSVWSYALSLLAINQYLNENPAELKKSKIQSIIAQSEALPDSVRKELGEKFSCVVTSIYSNQENGIMGIQDKASMEYYIDTSSYFVEFLKLDSDVAVDEGELGRIIITDLYNYAFPILRYYTGDLAKHKITIQNGRQRLILTELFGRHTDTIFDCNGIEISPFAISSRLADLDDIKQWQLIQVGQGDYQFIINPKSKMFDEAFAKELLLQALGENAHIDIKCTGEITVLASGKRRRIVNLCVENKAEGN